MLPIPAESDVRFVARRASVSETRSAGRSKLGGALHLAVPTIELVLGLFLIGLLCRIVMVTEECELYLRFIPCHLQITSTSGKNGPQWKCIGCDGCEQSIVLFFT